METEFEYFLDLILYVGGWGFVFLRTCGLIALLPWQEVVSLNIPGVVHPWTGEEWDFNIVGNAFTGGISSLLTTIMDNLRIPTDMPFLVVLLFIILLLLVPIVILRLAKTFIGSILG